MVVVRNILKLASAATALLQPCQALPTAAEGIFARQSTPLDSFIARQSITARLGVLDNIGGPTGAKVPGAGTGLVIASPSRSDPDYFFTWTRDAALTLSALIEQFLDGDLALQNTIHQYISAQARLQTVGTPSGGLSTGGLGEPKLNADGTAFTGPWGRPQRDGPSLRATTLITYANWLINNGHTTTANSVVWPVIQNDLSYVSQFWNQTGFDLWEEVNGSSFFTLASQHRALVEGAALATRLGKSCPNCVSQAPQILCFLKSFWNGQFIVSNINTNVGRTGKDANSILSSIQTFDPAANCDDATFQPCSPRALANHKAVTDSFRSIYGINAGIPAGTAVAVGRYAEDVYFGGNPWYLNTLAAAEQLYDALFQWNRIGSITITSVSLPFFRDIFPSAAVGTYPSSSATYTSIRNAVRAYADGYMSNAQKYTPASGALAEQYNRANGAPLSAVDLTWSYAAFLTASARRKGFMPPSWKAPTTVPGTCQASSANGPYAASTNTAFPTGLNPTSCTQQTTVTVIFNARVTTSVGQDVFVVGSIPQLGSERRLTAASLGRAILTAASQFQGHAPRLRLWMIPGGE